MYRERLETSATFCGRGRFNIVQIAKYLSMALERKGGLISISDLAKQEAVVSGYGSEACDVYSLIF